MKDDISNERARSTRGKTFSRIIAGIELLGGMSGVIYVVPLLWSNQPILVKTYALIAVFLFSIGMVAGFFLWRGQRLGFTLSEIFQLMQVPIVSNSAISYGLYALIRLGIVYNDLEIRLVFDISSGFNIGLMTGINEFLVGLNVFPIILLLILLKLDKED